MSETIANGAVSADPSARYYVRDHHPENGTLLGFWLYLMSDCLLFAGLFAAYAVLGRNYAGGPSGAELFELPTIALNTAFLLLSSITYGFAMIASQRKNVKATLIWLGITGLFGLAFLTLEIQEFMHLIHEGAGPQRSAFLTSFFALVGTHGLHVTFGSIWLVMAKVFDKSSTTAAVILAFAAVQVVVHMVYFLHMNGKAEGGWSMLATMFTLVLLIIVLAGSIWVMYHMNVNMMPSMGNDVHNMQDMQ